MIKLGLASIVAIATAGAAIAAPPDLKDIVSGLLEAIKLFKDWSNFLLVTTTAALGLVATDYDTKGSMSNKKFMRLSAWCLCFSAIFGIFTLAIVPIVTEDITGRLCLKKG